MRSSDEERLSSSDILENLSLDDLFLFILLLCDAKMSCLDGATLGEDSLDRCFFAGEDEEISKESDSIRFFAPLRSGDVSCGFGRC